MKHQKIESAKILVLHGWEKGVYLVTAVNSIYSMYTARFIIAFKIHSTCIETDWLEEFLEQTRAPYLGPPYREHDPVIVGD
jgi:hypothetical protein